MSRQSERIHGAAKDVILQLTVDYQEFSSQEIMAILDAARFTVMLHEFQQDRLGAEFIAESGGEPTKEEIQRWEDDGGR